MVKTRFTTQYYVSDDPNPFNSWVSAVTLPKYASGYGLHSLARARAFAKKVKRHNQLYAKQHKINAAKKITIIYKVTHEVVVEQL